MMSRATRRFFLLLLAGVCTAALLLIAHDPAVMRDPRPPRDIAGMAAWLARHPADWVVASSLSDAALDSTSPARFQIWLQAHDLAQRLAPRRPNATAAFVRGGLFHWYELSPADRRAVLEKAAPLLHEPRVFNELHRPLWQLTRDFEYLRRNAPLTLDAAEQLRRLAAFHGLFGQYPAMRQLVARRRLEMLQTNRATLSTLDMIRLLPSPPNASAEPLMRAILQELRNRSIETSQLAGLEGLVVYAIEHGLTPLDGVEPLVNAPEALSAAVRARLALAIDNPSAANAIELSSAITGSPEWRQYHAERAVFEARRKDRAKMTLHLERAAIPAPSLQSLAAAERALTLIGDTAGAAAARDRLRSLPPREWENSCGRLELCDNVRTETYTSSEHLRIALAVAQSDEIPPYVEIYVDGRLATEGPVDAERMFTVPVPDGLHKIRVELVNREMRNGAQRRLRLSRSVEATAAPAMAASVAGFAGMK